jgi:hypothetical protein
VSHLHPNALALLRAELAEEAASGFGRLRRVPQTDIIWFLDYFSGLTEAQRETHLDALANVAVTAFGPPVMPTLNARGTVDAPPGLAHMYALRERPGGKGGTRYTDIKMLGMDPSVREPGGYHPTWRENFTALHFQPRPDLLPDLSHLKAAKAPLLRKLVKPALTAAFGFNHEKLPGGTSKFMGRFGDNQLTVRVDYGMMLGQLSYSVSLKNAENQPLFLQLSYERLWGAGQPWDYVTEENAERSVKLLAEQIAYLAVLGQRLHT